MSAVPVETAVEPDVPTEAVVVKETKAFYLTSEFWITVGVILTAITGALPAGSTVAGVAVAVTAAAYAISRGLAKSGVPNVDTAVPEA